MKILMVTPFYRPFIGGVESVVENLSIRLNKRGIKTDVMTFNLRRSWDPMWREEREKINGVDVIRAPSINLLPHYMHIPHLTFRINLIPKRSTLKLLQNYDLIHFHSDIDLSFPFFSLPINKPKIFHCHVLDVTYDSYKRNFISKLVFRNVANIYIALSKLFSNLLSNLGIPKAKIRIVPNGIDTEIFQPKKEPKIENLLLFVGRLEEKKGLPILLKSLDYVKTSVHLVIIGPKVNPEYYEKILALIEKVNKKATHEVTYMGMVEKAIVLEWYQKASIFMCPSISESFPMVNLEALACGTPVIASNVGSIPEVVHDDENGILVSSKDDVKLAKAIQYLLDNEDIRRKFGENGRKLIEENFSTDVIIGKLCQIYKEMIY